MTAKTQTLPADSDQPCACCGRHHRKLTLIDGLWLGGDCAENYQMFLHNKDIKSPFWRGYEKKYYQVARMIGYKIA